MVYAAQSLLTRTVAGWVHDAGLGMAVCSTAELATALAGGMDPARIVVHGSGKSVDELATAAGAGVGRIVLDSPIEMAYLAGIARRPQAMLLQMLPGVDVLPFVRRALATRNCRWSGCTAIWARRSPNRRSTSRPCAAWSTPWPMCGRPTAWCSPS